VDGLFILVLGKKKGNEEGERRRNSRTKERWREGGQKNNYTKEEGGAIFVKV